MNTPRDYYWAGYLVTRNVAVFSKQEITGLLAKENIPQVQVVYAEKLRMLHDQTELSARELTEAQSSISEVVFDLPPLPQTSFDFFYWLDVFRRTITQHLHNGSPSEQLFNYGYDLGYAIAHCELLRYVTELEVLLPMQLSYRKQTDHLLRNIANTRHRLTVTGKVLRENWELIETLLQEVLHLSYENVEHCVVVEQQATLQRIVAKLEEITQQTADAFSVRFP